MGLDKEKNMQLWQYCRENYFTRRNKYFAYGCRFLESAAELAILLIVVIFIYIMLLYGIKTFWFFFSATPVGQNFAREFPDRARILQNIIYRDIVSFSITLTLKAFWVCLAASFITQPIHIVRIFYNARSLFHKVLFWGLPLAALTATFVKDDLILQNWKTAFVASLVPTLGIFTGCFHFTAKLLPELTLTQQKHHLERSPRKTKIVLAVSFFAGFISFLCYNYLIHPYWSNSGVFDKWDYFLYINGVGESLRGMLLYTLVFLPVWIASILLGVIIGISVLPPWKKAAMLCACGFAAAPFLLYGYSPWGSDTFSHWLIQTGLYEISVPLLLIAAWFSEKKRYHLIVYTPLPIEDNI